MVAIIFFLFSIWKDYDREKRKEQKENSQRNIHLLNLLEDAYLNVEQQYAINSKTIAQIRKKPTEAAPLDFLPTGYLTRLSSALANDSYFTAYNYSYAHINQQQRMKIYNDFSMDLDRLQTRLAELHSYPKSSAEILDNYRESYLQKARTLLTELTELLIQLEEDIAENQDKEELTRTLYNIDTDKMFQAIAEGDIIKLDDEFVGSIHLMLSGLLRPDSAYLKEIMKMCDICQQTTEEYQNLLHTNLALAQRLAQLNGSLEETIGSFGKKLVLVRP
ncbi:hypothetical protein [Pedobacter xixiisoli]|nr:hypothetical protein [Pedobacter xixiisoli]